MKDRYSPSEWLSFRDLVDALVMKVIARGRKDFNEILLSLPGVYPTVLLDALKGLVTRGKIPKEILRGAIDTIGHLPNEGPSVAADTFTNLEQCKLPLPHPLDFEWRFSEKAIDNLLHEALQFTTPNDIIALFGTPSVLWRAFRTEYPRELILFESSKQVCRFLNNQNVPGDSFTNCDLTKDDLPKISSRLIISDPPWYPKYVKSFLWAASQICNKGGYLLLSTPPVGTRPKVLQEWEDSLNWAETLGFSLIEMQECVLPYVTPPFERNALKAEGINWVPKEWRRGNLATFVREYECKLPRRPLSPSKGCWVEEAVEGIRFQFRRKDQTPEFIDPSLTTIVPGDILPSVSRYDERREKADVWTSGNRIFKCEGTAVLKEVVAAIAEHTSPISAVEHYVNRNLKDHEIQLIDETATRVALTTKIEQAECLHYEAF